MRTVERQGGGRSGHAPDCVGRRETRRLDSCGRVRFAAARERAQRRRNERRMGQPGRRRREMRPLYVAANGVFANWASSRAASRRTSARAFRAAAERASVVEAARKARAGGVQVARPFGFRSVAAGVDGAGRGGGVRDGDVRGRARRRAVVLLPCPAVALSIRRSVDPSICRSVDLSSRRSDKPSIRRAIELSDWRAVRLPIALSSRKTTGQSIRRTATQEPDNPAARHRGRFGSTAQRHASTMMRLSTCSLRWKKCSAPGITTTGSSCGRAQS